MRVMVLPGFGKSSLNSGKFDKQDLCPHGT